MRGLFAIAALTCAIPATADDARIGGDLGQGTASYFSREIAGNRTASGERCNPEALTAAHRTAPFGSKMRVTNLSTGQSVIVRINDRGPFRASRIIDLSHAAAREIGMHRTGTAKVSLTLLTD